MNILSDKIVTTRKPHRCDACGRVFPKGTKMKTQVNTFDGIRTWRTCPTCTELLAKFGFMFIDEVENVFWDSCVCEMLEKGQTPEDLLKDMMFKAFREIIK